ncbi:hypothetical protein FZW96_21335 [Bacillus sp. BGMRC 2118]|nr:hypothetical protein FZW96_21335 [Bacillus sp. BGMRC 2118]
MKIRLFILCTFLLTACTGNQFEREDIVAELNGNEIKVEDILWQYSLDENPEAIVLDYLKQEVVIQEAKDKGITVTEEEIEERKQAMFPNSNANDRFEVFDEKEFYEKQAAILEVTPEHYYKVWEANTYTKQEYVEKYIEMNFGEPTDDEDVDVWGQEIEKHIKELFDKYKNEGKLITK